MSKTADVYDAEAAAAGMNQTFIRLSDQFFGDQFYGYLDFECVVTADRLADWWL